MTDPDIETGWDALYNAGIYPSSPGRVDDNLDMFTSQLEDLRDKLYGEEEGLTVIDWGCGDGYTSYELADRLGGDYMFLGIELSSFMAEKAEGNASGIDNFNVEQGDGRDVLNGKEGSVDVVMAINSFQELEDFESVIQNPVRDALRQDGELWITWPGENAPLSTGYDEDRKVDYIEVPIDHEVWMDAGLDGYNGFLEGKEIEPLRQYYWSKECVAAMLENASYSVRHEDRLEVYGEGVGQIEAILEASDEEITRETVDDPKMEFIRAQKQALG